MTPNASYIARFDLRLTDSEDRVCDMVRGREYKTASFASVVDAVTGEVLNLPLHVARNPRWYFTQPGFGQHLAQPAVTQAEYIAAIVRGNEGLDAGELYKTIQAEQFAPLGGKAMTYNVFTSYLAKDTGIEMRKDGVPVNGTSKDRGHLSGCTYHVKTKARRVDGWAA